MVEDLSALVAVESPSTDLPALRRSAEAVRTVVLRRTGREPELTEPDGVPCIRLRIGAEEPHRRVVLLAHHDTVWPVGTLASMPFSVADGVIRGPGTVDMKAGLVMAIHAVAALLETGRADGIGLLVTGDEEVGSFASRALITEECTGVRAALVLEGAARDGSLKVARKGTSDYRIVAHGRAAHAGIEPWSGANATVALARLVDDVLALGRDDRATTVTPTVLHSGTTSNTVPATGSLSVDVRATTSDEQRRVDTAIRALRSRVEGVRLEITGGVNRPPMEPSIAAALFDRATAIADDLGVGPLGRVSVGGASDGNLTAAIGTPTLDGLGAVGGGAHAADEHVRVEHLASRTALVAALAAEILAA